MINSERIPSGPGRRPKLLTLKQVAEQLNVNERHIRRLVAERLSPGHEDVVMQRLAEGYAPPVARRGAEILSLEQ